MTDIESVYVQDIHVGDRLRHINRDTVETLKQSIARIGLKVPISVRLINEVEGFKLVAGLHRLEACRELGMTEVPVVEETGTDIDARMWEIGENFHRIELTPLERSKHEAKWIELCERRDAEKKVSGQVVPKPRQGGRPESVITKASRELGVTKKDLYRSIKVASLSDEAQQEAAKLGLDDNRSALLKAAEHKTPDAQVKALQEHAATPRETRKPSPKPEPTAAPEPQEPATPGAPPDSTGDNWRSIEPHIKAAVLEYEKLPPRYRKMALFAMDGIGLDEHRKDRKDVIRLWTIENYKVDWLLKRFGVEVTWPKFDVWVGGCGDNDTRLSADGEPVIAGPLAAAEPAALDLVLDDLQSAKPDEAGDPSAPKSKTPASEAPADDGPVEKIAVPAERAFGDDPLTTLRNQYTELSNRFDAYDWVMRRLSHGETPGKHDKGEVAEFVCRFIAAPAAIQNQFRASIGERPDKPEARDAS
jgi:ParB family chromosome partitioning protein